MQITAKLVDIKNRDIYPATVAIADGKIVSVVKVEVDNENSLAYMMPGFIDAHVHIESSMLIPAEFARLAVVHGTVGTVSDPHEIANVCGLAGVEYMIENGKTVPFKFNFGAPSCVPATTFETAGANISAGDVAALLKRDEIKYLTEMMNFPGVLNNDPEVMAKIKSALDAGKPVDGHAPGLRGEQARQYIEAGISTDHECFTQEEALDKLSHGMKILIREGSAAKNFDALADLLHDHSEHIMFCSDDKHPDSLVASHINELCSRASHRGIDVFKILQAACINPVEHYKLNIGLLQVGDDADFILVKNLSRFEVLQTYINGVLVADEGQSKISGASAGMNNNFDCIEKIPEDFIYFHEDKFDGLTPVIEAIDGQLITNKLMVALKPEDGILKPDLKDDILKIAVVNRYHHAPIAKAFIKNFGLTEGAIASSVAHDSHNIVVVGVDDESICRAVNLIIKARGGISCVSKNEETILPLPVAGLMSDQDGYEVAKAYTDIDAKAKKLGSALSAPFMTLSFMALLVIPHLKLSDKGLFDGNEFKLI
ncbi:adenine deaminase [Mucilaginibacter paludis]|uniref:Adenine deaminase n=1 Tax=Mucilaginibacter paludis DSM 18603 TaxID=714943 RepID=H1Y7W9_9SPHI|nr:adenine deaminase [Mucilaginibacter paludis]EHQ30455.1 Adenine deaminase [Mucilaginibacter paludis DSM 18603]